MKYVIIGNGIAGLSAADEIRKNDAMGSIVIISNEEHLTYYRVKLSHYISNTEYSVNDLLVHNESWYKEKNIEVILNEEVIKIDTEKKGILTKQGNNINYDKLLIANGSSPFVPPIEGVNKKGVFALRTLNNLMEIQDYLKNCETVSVIGGGLLGIEAAWALKTLGKKVNIIEFFPYLLPRQLDKELGEYLKEQLEAEGLNFYLDVAAKSFEGENKVEAIKLNNGNTVETGGVLISAGIRSNLSIGEGTSINMNKGIVVDQFMRTNIDDVYAAGDICEFDEVVFGLWTSGMDQGKVAGSNMSGQVMTYEKPQPATTLTIGNIKMFSVGNVTDADREVSIRGDNHFHKLFVRENKLIGGVLIGDLKKMIALKKAVNEQRDISRILDKHDHPEDRNDILEDI